MQSRLLICVGALTAALFNGCSYNANRSLSQINPTSVVTSQSPSATLNQSPAKPLQAERIEQTWPSKFSFEAKSIERKHEGLRSYEVSVDCPQIINRQTPATRRFNRWMLRKIRGYVRHFESLEKAAEVHDKRKRLKKAPIDEALSIGYYIYYSDERLISLRLTHSVMALGQMHPIDYYETINYDLETVSALRPSNVFLPGYLKVLSKYARIELKNKYDLEDGVSNGGTKPREENFKNWNIVPDGVLLSFEDYQIASHAFGQAEMLIPFAVLKPVLRRTGVVNKFTRQM